VSSTVARKLTAVVQPEHFLNLQFPTSRDFRKKCMSYTHILDPYPYVCIFPLRITEQI
jgi:hypothetical protein